MLAIRILLLLSALSVEVLRNLVTLHCACLTGIGVIINCASLPVRDARLPALC